MEAPPPESVRRQLGRLARGRARLLGGARAGRWHLVVLVAACLLAFVHRAIVPIPGFDAIRDSWPLLLGVAAGLFALGPILRMLFASSARLETSVLARELDDRFGWHDETDTAAALAPDAAAGGLGSLVTAQAGGRLRELDAASLARAGRPWGRVRLVLTLLFVALLILPGVGGLFGGSGAGTQGGDGIGTAGADEDFGAPGPMKADFWFQAFVENPIPVEPLPPREPKESGDAEAKAGEDAKQEGAK